MFQNIPLKLINLHMQTKTLYWWENVGNEIDESLTVFKLVEYNKCQSATDFSSCLEYLWYALLRKDIN